MRPIRRIVVLTYCFQHLCKWNRYIKVSSVSKPKSHCKHCTNWDDGCCISACSKLVRFHCMVQRLMHVVKVPAVSPFYKYRERGSKKSQDLKFCLSFLCFFFGSVIITSYFSNVAKSILNLIIVRLLQWQGRIKAMQVETSNRWRIAYLVLTFLQSSLPQLS